MPLLRSFLCVQGVAVEEGTFGNATSNNVFFAVMEPLGCEHGMQQLYLLTDHAHMCLWSDPVWELKLQYYLKYIATF